jgi:hypothetical protein
LARVGFDTLAHDLQKLVEKTLRKNGDDPDKALHSGIAGLVDRPELLFALYGAEKIQADYLKHSRAWLQVQLHQAAAMEAETKAAAEKQAAAERQAAQRKEARAGHTARADKASVALPAAPRRSDEAGGQWRGAVNDGQRLGAPASSPQSDGRGHFGSADDGHASFASPSLPKGDGEGHSHRVSNDQDARAPSSPSIRGAGATVSVPKGQRALASAAAKHGPKPVPEIPVKQERKPLFDPEAVRQANREIAQAETFKIWDGRTDFYAAWRNDPANVERRYKMAWDEGVTATFDRIGKLREHGAIRFMIAEIKSRERSGKQVSPADVMAMKQKYEKMFDGLARAYHNGGAPAAHIALKQLRSTIAAVPDMEAMIPLFVAAQEGDARHG